MNTWLLALIGGALIGLSATLMLVLHGRVAGISGILYSVLFQKPRDYMWRWNFLLGILLTGLFLYKYWPQNLMIAVRPLWIYAAAGALVGFGTVLGNGCTSGHGVCGISRFSARSLMATITFIATGIVVTFFTRSL